MIEDRKMSKKIYTKYFTYVIAIVKYDRYYDSFYNLHDYFNILYNIFN